MEQFEKLIEFGVTIPALDSIDLKSFFDFSISIKPSHLFGCGEARGGQLKAGGPCWLDFLEEFTDNEEIGPQLIGHTQNHNTIRFKGKSFCIDGGQTTYALLDSSGKIEFKSTISGELNIVEETGWQYNGWIN